MLNKMKSAFGGKGKIIVSLLGLFALLFTTVGTSYAATNVQLQTPPSQTNQDTINLTFVALDTTSSQTVSVDCWKKGPTDGAFSIFQSFSLPNGGNTDSCNASFNQGNGTYSFYVTAGGSGSATSSTVSTDFNNSKPGDPGNYKKEKIDSCTYKIWFHTANDSGKTVKVRLYRSDQLSFSVDSAHQVNELNIGSNTDGSMTDNISPNCDKTYYYVIRAFDVYGNGSGVVGDDNVTTTIVTTTSTTPAQGAIPVGGTGGSVLGEGAGGEEAEKEVLGTESAEPTEEPEKTQASQNPVANAINWVLNNKPASLALLILIIAIAYYLYRRYKK